MKIINNIILSSAGENGYVHDRIPGICVCPDGTMLVYYECRRGRNDWTVSEIGMKKSSDGGKSWSAERYISFGDGKNTVNNPMMAWYEGELVFIWLENYKRAFIRTSSDLGESWTEKYEITEVLEKFRPEYPWTTAAFGPGHLTVTKSGRIISPIWLCSNPANIFAHGPSLAATVFSDDGGKTWERGEIIASGDIPSPNEGCMAETSRSIILNIRNISDKKRRAWTESGSGVGEWSECIYKENLPDPICASGMTSAEDILYYSGCDSTEDRVNLTLSRSSDFGDTWERLLINESGGYSDVCVNPATGTAFVVYEADHETKICIAEIKLK